MAVEAQAAIAAWYIEQMATLRAQVESAQTQAFHAAGDYSDDAADAYVATIVPVMAGAQTAAAQLTAAYLAYMAADMAGRALSSVVAPGVDLTRLTGAALRNGVPPEVVYRRPFQQVWTEIARAEKKLAQRPTEPSVPVPSPSPRVPAIASPGGNEAPARRLSEPKAPPTREEIRADAVKAGERRAQTIAATDLQLATTHTAQDALAANQQVVGYRRVLTGAENCGMCVVVSTRLYHKRNLLPIHPGCDCVVAPVMAGEDPGRTINNRLLAADAVPAAFNKHGVPVFDADQTIDLGDLLQDTHDAISGRFGQSYRDAKRIDYRKVITVHQHGEVGPVLTVARHKFTKRQIEQSDLRAR